MKRQGLKDITRSDNYSNNSKLSVEEGIRVLKEAELSMLPKAAETVSSSVPLTSLGQEQISEMTGKVNQALVSSSQIWRFSFAVVVGRKDN